MAGTSQLINMWDIAIRDVAMAIIPARSIISGCGQDTSDPISPMLENYVVSILGG